MNATARLRNTCTVARLHVHVILCLVVAEAVIIPSPRGRPGGMPSDGDRLKAINNAVRGQEDAGPWLPLESNPDVFTSFARKVGLPAPWEFRDVWGLDDDMLAMMPRPVAAVILLFPCTDRIYAERAEEARRLKAAAAAGGPGAVSAAYHLEQVASFGNACGTIACMHVLTNVKLAGMQGPASKFRAETSEMTAAERGRALLTTQHLRQESDQAAEHVAAQTHCPARDGPSLDHHYCAFVPLVSPATGVEHVVELDGTKIAAVDHGPVGGSGRFLEAVADVVRRRFMQLEPDNAEFSMMALCQPPTP